jgi:arylsulfate sulfotransferase
MIHHCKVALLRNALRMVLMFSLGWLGVAQAMAAQHGPLPQFTTPPSIVANPNPNAPLAAVITFATNTPVATTLTVSDGQHSWNLQYAETRDPKQGLPVIGMRPERQHSIHIAIQDAAGQKTTAPQPLTFITPAIPKDGIRFPPINITTHLQEATEPGLVLLSVRRRRPGRNPDTKAFNQKFGILMIIDKQGDVLWYYQQDSRISDFKLLSNGNIVYLTQDYRAIEIDWLGNVVQTWFAEKRPKGPVPGAIPIAQTPTFHHDIDEVPSGNLIVLGTDHRQIDNYYTSETDANAPRASQEVVADRIIEFERDGTIVWDWNAFDFLDPFRIGYETFRKYWVRRGFPDAVDWTHANNLIYFEHDNSLLVSFRYQAAILKLDRATGKIRWILGEPSGWPAQLQDKLLKATGEMRWFYHQHSPEPTPHGTVLVFDNGSYQARPFTPPVPPAQTYSRAVEYAIDEENMTVKEVWTSEIPGEEKVVTFAMGNVEWLPKTKNLLVGYGLILPNDHLEQITWKSVIDYRSWTRVREFTHTQPAQVVWEMVMNNEDKDNPVGWIVFRAEHMSSLQPSPGR